MTLRFMLTMEHDLRWGAVHIFVNFEHEVDRGEKEEGNGRSRAAVQPFYAHRRAGLGATLSKPYTLHLKL